MHRYEAHELFDKIIDELGIHDAMQELLQALSDDEIIENAEWIARMYDIELYDE